MHFQSVRYTTELPFRGVWYTAEPTFCQISPWIFGKNRNRPRVHLMGPGGAIWWKTNTQKSPGTVPLKSDEIFAYSKSGSMFYFQKAALNTHFRLHIVEEKIPAIVFLLFCNLARQNACQFQFIRSKEGGRGRRGREVTKSEKGSQ